MTTGLGPRDRRTLAVGIGAIVSLLALSRGLPAFRSWDERQRTAAAALVARLASAQRAARALPALRDSLARRRIRMAIVDSTLVRAASGSAAAASLASIVEDLADDASVRVAALQLRADSVPHGGLSTVGVRLTGVADVVALAAFLRAVDGGERHTVVRELSVSQSEPAAPASKPEMLRIDVLIEAPARILPEAAR